MISTDISRCALWTGPVAACLAFALWPVLGAQWALCLFASALWGAANLWALGRLLEAIVLRQPLLQGFIALQLKLAILFGGGAALVLTPFFMASAFLVGFHVVFTVIAVNVIRSAMAARTTHEETA